MTCVQGRRSRAQVLTIAPEPAPSLLWGGQRAPGRAGLVASPTMGKVERSARPVSFRSDCHNLATYRFVHLRQDSNRMRVPGSGPRIAHANQASFHVLDVA